jgi:hypothetical protein
MTCAKLAGMLEQAPATAVIHPPECVPARGRMSVIGRAGPLTRRLARRAWLTAFAAALLALGPGCSLLLDFDVPPIDAAPIADAAAPDATVDAAGPDAGDGGASMPDGGPVVMDAMTPLRFDER